MVEQFFLSLPQYPKGCHLITNHITQALGALPEKGLLHVFIQHTSAGLAINENADADVRHDLDEGLDLLAPENQPFYLHNDEGPDDMPAHLKSVLVGSSVTIPITQGKLNLGTWQGVYLCEFRKSASPRRLVLTLVA